MPHVTLHDFIVSACNHGSNLRQQLHHFMRAPLKSNMFQHELTAIGEVLAHITLPVPFRPTLYMVVICFRVFRAFVHV